MSEIVSSYCIWIFIVPALTAMFILLFGNKKFLREWVALIGMIITLIISIVILIETQSKVLIEFGSHLRIDSLSSLFSFIISVIGLMVIIYSFKYVEREKEKGIISDKKVKSFYWQVMLFISTMLFATTTNNIIILWVIIEATTLASAILVAFYWNKDSVEAGYKYLMLLTVGISFALFGCVLLYSGAASSLIKGEPLQISVISEAAKAGIIPSSIILLAVAFLIVGFGTKAGIAPFHAWLPDAHAEAPTPVSALLSGVMIKVGVYALIRTVTMFYTSFSIISVFIVILGIFTMVVGVFMMFIQEDLKRFLAYSSVSQMGYIIMGLGLSGVVPAMSGVVKDGSYISMYGSLFHIVNHSIIKSLLFLCVGAIVFKTGIRRINELGGLGRKMPITAFCFFIGGLAISGVPMLNGFMSKFTLFLAGVKVPGMVWTTVVAIICSILTLASFVHVSYRIFIGPISSELKSLNISEVPASMWLMMFVLVLFCFILGVSPQVIYPILNNATNVVLSIISKGGL
jgi:hydrogenase-4 component F